MVGGATTYVNEIFKDTLEECLQCTIRWQGRMLRGTQRYATNNVADATQVFEFSKDGVGNGTPTVAKTYRMIALESVVGSNSSPYTRLQLSYTRWTTYSIASTSIFYV